VLVYSLVLLASAAEPARAQYRPRPLNDPMTGEAYHIEAAVDYWFPTADMTISSESLGLQGTDVNFKNDLGLTDQRFPALHLQIKAGGNKLRFEYIPINYSQSAILRQDIIFNGQRYQLGLPVNSTLDWKAFRFGYEYDFLRRSRGFLGFILEAKYTDVNATLVTPPISAHGGINEFDHARAPIPAIGGTGRFYIVPNIAVTADITGFRLPGNVVKDASGHYFDVDVYGTLNFTNNIGVQGGYRSLDVGYGFRTDSGSFVLKGMYFGGVVRY
jgi:hypothetical protein